MSEVTLLTIIVAFIVLLIAIIHFYDRYLVKEIDLYEKRLVKKGIFKRHFIKTGSSKKKMIIKCKNCSNEFVVEDIDIPASGRIVKCSHCSVSWRQMPNIA